MTDTQADVTIASKRATLPVVLRSVTNLVRACGCSFSKDATQLLVNSVGDVTEFIVRNNRLLVIPSEVSKRIGGGTIKLTKSWMESFIGQLDVPKADRQKYINSVTAALTMCIESACSATKRMRQASKSPIVNEDILGMFLKHYTH